MNPIGTAAIGIDFGGTKIEAAAIGRDGSYLKRIRMPTPKAYDPAIAAVAELVVRLEGEIGLASSFGIGVPGSPAPHTGLIRNANATFLNGKPFARDLSAVTGKAVAIDNDANCFALSEATDGAGANRKTVFAVIIGTGCGGGLVFDGRILAGANGIAGEWGHSPLPSPTAEEYPGPTCWCGRRNCIERWVSGTGVREAYRARAGVDRSPAEIVLMMRLGDDLAVKVINQWLDRLARSLAVVINLIDPDVIVFGGGMANVHELYQRLPTLITPHVFSDRWSTQIAAAKWGDASGVRGAAWLGVNVGSNCGPC